MEASKEDRGKLVVGKESNPQQEELEENIAELIAEALYEVLARAKQANPNIDKTI